MEMKKAVLDSLFLLNQSPKHLQYSLSDFNRYILYPIIHNKIRLFYDKNDKPIALVTWAWLDEHLAVSFLEGDYALEEEDYVPTTGPQLWGIEFVAPYGDTLKVMRAMRKVSHSLHGKGHTVHWRRLSNPTQPHTGAF
tara:strand:+ start:1105 stop:1518 length:414 start_codon:yes stop_codon:yes gene_type:complete